MYFREVRPGDWASVQVNFQRAGSIVFGSGSSPIFAGLTLSGLTASTLIGVNASKALESVTIGTGLDYATATATLSFSHLGIEALTDPGADKILFWDDNTTACGWLGVGNSIAITTTTIDTIQDIRTTASPTFANLSLGTGELTCGSINRAAGTLTLEINGTAEISITATTSTFGGNILIPDAGQIGSASDPNAITISATGIIDITAHDGSAAGLSLGGTLVTSTAAEINLLDGLTGVQQQGDVLDDLNTLGANPFTGDPAIDFLVGTAAGTLAWQSGSTARTSIGLGTTDNPTFAALTVTTINGAYLKYTATGNYSIGDSTTLDALDANPEHNIAIGDGAGSGITDGDNNIFIGYRAGYEKTTHMNNVAIGYEAWYKGTGNYAVAIGYQAGRYHSGGNNNTLVGYQAGLGVGTGAAYVYNTIVGSGSGVALTTGSYNVLLGYYSGNDLTSGANNIFVGHLSGAKQTTLSNLLIVDSQTRADAAAEATDAILYGVMAAAPANQTLALNAVTTVSQNLIGDGVLFLKERADQDTDKPGYGQIWVKTATPNTLWFTDDAGTDFQLGLAAAASTWIALTDTDPANYVGEAGNCVVVNAGEDGLEFGAAPGGGGAFSSRISVYQSSAQSINHNSDTVLQFQTENYDNDGEYDNSSTWKFIATAAGYYHVVLKCTMSLGVNNKAIYPKIKKNGTEVARNYGFCITAISSQAQQIVSKDVYLDGDTDYIEGIVYHNAGAAKNTVTGDAETFMTIHRFA